MSGLGRHWPLLALGLTTIVVVVSVLLQVLFPFPNGPSSLLTVLAGIADVAKRSAPFLPAADETVLAFDDRVRTRERSNALITFFDGSTIELEPLAEIHVDEVAPLANGAITIRMTQAVGRSWSAVARSIHPASRYEIRTPAAAIATRGTGFEARYALSSFIRSTSWSM